MWERIGDAANDLYLLARKWVNYSPMVLDLDGDGIETLGADNSQAILFDHDGDGIKTGTGWIKADDALLVLDRNGNGTIDNGSELFGVDTVLADGRRAADGYVAMRELDGNGDGVLNSSDGRFGELKVWRDLNQDGVSQANELQSLNQAGIASLDLAATVEAEHLLPGNNWQILSSTYTRTDGSTATLADIDFADNGFYREYPDHLDTSAVQDLPAMAGSGLVRDLQEAATLSTRLVDQLRTLQAQGYVGREQYLGQIKQLIDAWADTSSLKTLAQRQDMTSEEVQALGLDGVTSVGGHQMVIQDGGGATGITLVSYYVMYQPPGVEGDLLKAANGLLTVGSDFSRVQALSDEQKTEQLAKWERATYLIETLERYNGQPFVDFHPDGTVTTGGRQSIAIGAPSSTSTTGGGANGLGGVAPLLVSLSEVQLDLLEQSYDQLMQSVYEGMLLQTRFKGYMDAIDLQIDETGIRLDFTRMDGMLAERYATDAQAGLEDLIDLIKVNDHQVMGLGWTSGLATLRTWAAEVSLDPAQSHILTELNIKFVDGTAGSLYAPVTHEIFLAGAGNDTIYAGGGDDLISAGAGDDYIYCEAGTDTIFFNRGDGRDSVVYRPEQAGGTEDILQFGAGIAASDIRLTHTREHDLVLAIKGTTDQISLRNYFLSDGMGGYALRAIQFADGTRWDVDAVKALAIQGTDEAESLWGYATDDTISGGAGNDVISGLFGNDTLDGGAGDDIMEGGSGDDLLLGAEGDDRLYGNEGNDTLIGGAGNEYLYGGAGSDTYVFNRGDGQDNILNDDVGTSNTDVLQFAADIASTDVTAKRLGNSLILAVSGTTDSVTVLNYFNNDGASGYVLNEIRFGDGVSWDLSTVKVLVAGGTAGADTLYGTAGDDWLDGLAGNDYLYGGAGNDGLAGGDGADRLYGQDGDDSLHGGAGDDILEGYTGNDTLAGGAGNDSLYGWIGSDTYVFNRGDGQDTINTYDVGTGQTDVLQFGPGIAPSDIKITRSGDTLILSIKDTTDKVTISQYFYQDGISMYKLDLIQFADGTAWDLATVKVLAIQSTDGADILTGYATDDILSGGAGNDSLSGRGGNDSLTGGDGADSVYGDDGNDTLDGGTGNDFLYGGAGNDLLLGGADSDILSGHDGNDTLVGGASYDTLDGGAGSDTYQFGRGDGQDTISNSDSGTGKTDVLQFAADINSTDVSATRSGSDLVLSIIGATDKVTIKNYFYNDGANHYKVDEMRFGDGVVWNFETLRVKVMEGTAGADVLSGYATDDTLSGLAGNDTLFGRAGNDTFSGGAGTDYLYGDVGNDTYLLGRGHGSDTVIDYDATTGNTDVAQFLDGISSEQIWFRRSGNNLEASIIGTSDKLTISNWYSGNQYHVEQLKTADGKTLVDSKVENLVQAMAAFSPPAAGQTTLPPTYQDALGTTIAANWQ